MYSLLPHNHTWFPITLNLIWQYASSSEKLILTHSNNKKKKTNKMRNCKLYTFFLFIAPKNHKWLWSSFYFLCKSLLLK